MAVALGIHLSESVFVKPDVLHFQGLIMTSQKKWVLMINHKSYTPDKLPKAIQILSISPKKILIQSKGQKIHLTIGDKIKIFQNRVEKIDD
jgi:hypothetical protein